MMPNAARPNGLLAITFLLTAVLLGRSTLGAADLPPPAAVKGTIEVGCYYFPGWFAAERWTPVREFGSPQPLLGYYDEDIPEVADWHIRWAVEHGITFFAFDWYYDHESGTVTAHNAALDRGFLHSRYAELMKFCIFWCNESPSARRITRDQMVTLAHVLRDRYFKQRNYLRIDGKPVVFVSRPLAQLEAMGVERTATVFAEMAREAGEPGGLFFVANGSERLEDLQRAGFSALSAYNYADVGVSDASGKKAPYADMVKGYEDLWKTMSSQKLLPYIPPLSPGWDSRPWYGKNAFVRTGSTPELFATMCTHVKPYVDPKLKMVIVECWNEFGEGSYIEPTEAFGFSMLDAIRAAFCPGAGPHEHLLPCTEKRPGLAFPDVPAFVDREIATQGGNLLFNPGFERAYGWAYFDGEPARPIAATPHSGRQCMAVSVEKGGLKSLHLVPLEGKARYEVSLWVKGRAEVSYALFDENKYWLRRNVRLGTTDDGDSWRVFRAAFAVDEPKAKYIDLEVVPLRSKQTQNTPNSPVGGQVLVDDVELRKTP